MPRFRCVRQLSRYPKRPQLRRLPEPRGRPGQPERQPSDSNRLDGDNDEYAWETFFSYIGAPVSSQPDDADNATDGDDDGEDGRSDDVSELTSTGTGQGPASSGLMLGNIVREREMRAYVGETTKTGRAQVMAIALYVVDALQRWRRVQVARQFAQPTWHVDDIVFDLGGEADDAFRGCSFDTEAGRQACRVAVTAPVAATTAQHAHGRAPRMGT